MSIIEKRKQIKKNNIIRVIRDFDDVSRYVLKKKTKYSMTTILNSVTSLLEEGLVVEEESTQKNVGRTPVYLRINPDGRYFIGVEFNAERVKVSVVNFAAEVIHANIERLPKDVSVNQVLAALERVIAEALEVIDDRRKVAGIGIGVPGYVDRQSGEALQYSYIRDWKNIPVRQIIEDRFGLKVFVDNNINTLAYHYMYEHKDKDNFMIVSMQYGVRLGLVMKRKLFVGNSGNAGEIGHTIAAGGTRRCGCGKTGCLDSEISYIAIEEKVYERIESGELKGIQAAMEEKGGKFTMEMLGEAIRSGDGAALALMDDITGTLGRKLSTVISVIDIEDIIVLNVCDMDNERFAAKVYGTVRDNTLTTLVDSVRVSCEIVDPYAASKGAAIMILEEKFGYRKEV